MSVITTDIFDYLPTAEPENLFQKVTSGAKSGI